MAALLFLYKDVLECDPGWLDDVVRAKRSQRLPVVLTRKEVEALLAVLHGVSWLMAMLLYGEGLREWYQGPLASDITWLQASAG